MDKWDGGYIIFVNELATMRNRNHNELCAVFNLKQYFYCYCMCVCVCVHTIEFNATKISLERYLYTKVNAIKVA